eukprot:TRINITY_DN6383_c0_g1_i1.p1 TRINITY_DN6383_c0_g1~~TRINITY_DN6383_c0_g1_i1.p1  ORF type:complete len:231 (+),score=56.43 TRINITY_DN6383_c0_g1_i1:354-1046(+)
MILESKLLSEAESSGVKRAIGDGSQGVAMTVIRLFVGENGRLEWICQGTGVLCLVKDYERRNFFMQFYKMDSGPELTWEMELYLELRLKFRGDRFYEFEGETSSVAFQFADLSESECFVSSVDGILTKKRERIKRRDIKKHGRAPPSASEVNNNRGGMDSEKRSSNGQEEEKDSGLFSTLFSRKGPRASKNKNNKKKSVAPRYPSPRTLSTLRSIKTGKLWRTLMDWMIT